MSKDTHYTILDVSETATQSEIKAAYRSLLKKIHPDTVFSLSSELRLVAESVTKDINEAYSVLSDPERRCHYDAQLVESRRQFRSATLGQSAAHTYRQFSRPSTRRGQRRYRRTSQPRSLKYWLRHRVVALIVVLLLCFVSALLMHYVLPLIFNDSSVLKIPSFALAPAEATCVIAVGPKTD